MYLSRPPWSDLTQKPHVFPIPHGTTPKQARNVRYVDGEGGGNLYEKSSRNNRGGNGGLRRVYLRHSRVQEPKSHSRLLRGLHSRVPRATKQPLQRPEKRLLIAITFQDSFISRALLRGKEAKCE